MRITIEVDEKSSSPAATATNIGGSDVSVATTPSTPGASAPAEVLAQAAASGAINAGPAPAQAVATSVAPDPFHLLGGAATGAAESGGAAPKF